MDLVFSCIIEEARDEVVATDPWFVICSIKAWQDQKKDNEYIDVASLAVKQYLNLSMPAVALLIISANTWKNSKCNGSIFSSHCREIPTVQRKSNICNQVLAYMTGNEIQKASSIFIWRNATYGLCIIAHDAF